MSYGCDHDTCKNCVDPADVAKLRAEKDELQKLLHMALDYLEDPDEYWKETDDVGRFSARVGAALELDAWKATLVRCEAER